LICSILPRPRYVQILASPRNHLANAEKGKHSDGNRTRPILPIIRFMPIVLFTLVLEMPSFQPGLARRWHCPQNAAEQPDPKTSMLLVSPMSNIPFGELRKRKLHKLPFVVCGKNSLLKAVRSSSGYSDSGSDQGCFQ
jgi:hypothetical protein